MSTIDDKRKARSDTASTVSKLSAYPPSRTGGLRPFAPGQSGNPRGRKKGSRNKLSEDFLSALTDDFTSHGAAVIAKVRKSRPHEYLKIVASVIPREFDMKPEPSSLEELTDEGLTEMIRECEFAMADEEPR